MIFTLFSGRLGLLHLCDCRGGEAAFGEDLEKIVGELT